MPTKITDTNISATGVVAGSYTSANITVNESGQITSASSGASIPKITQIEITDNSYVTIDDTAVSTSGGYIKISGSNFSSNCQVIIGTLLATSVSFISSTEVRAQVPSQVAGTYTVYLTNSDGSVAIRVNGLNYSATPSWQTSNTLSTGYKNSAISIQLLATSNSTVVYQLQAGSTLPNGLTLSSTGLLSGTVSTITVNTTYNFTVVAIDSELQDTPQAFQISILIADLYYYLTTLLLSGNGTNNAQNNTFLDSSTNNFTITRSGNTTQGTFSPFSQTGWGNYFGGAGNYFTVANNSAFDFGSGDFTLEAWFYLASSTNHTIFTKRATEAVYSPFTFGMSASLFPGFNASFTGSSWAITMTSTVACTQNAWNHLALTRNGSNFTIWVNGISGATATGASALMTNTSPVVIAAGAADGASPAVGYISNARIVKGVAVYTGAFTVPSSPLTATQSAGTNISAITGTQTSLLTCQSNRFIDNSTNNFTITRTGTPSVQAFSPFNPTAPWSATTNGGSGYFDGSGDFLTAATNSAVLDSGSGTITVEAWVYLTTNVSGGAFGVLVAPRGTSGTSGLAFGFVGSGGTTRLGVSYVAVGYSGTLAVPLNAWTHVAYVLTNATTCKTYHNGVLDATFSLGGTQNVQGLCVAAGDTGASPIVGYISNLRVVKNVTVYTANFTPPTAPVTAIANTSLLLNFTNAGIYDATGRNDLETVGNAQISTAQYKFPPSSMAFDGTGDYLSAANISRGLEMLTGDFTIECWIRFNVVGNGQIVTGLAATNTLYWQYYSSQLAFGQNNVANIAATNWSPSSGVWYHIAVTRSGSTVRQFVDGTQLGSNATSSASFANGPIQIGDGGAGGFNGYIQDLRITKGYARYTANFTIPSSAFPTQ